MSEHKKPFSKERKDTLVMALEHLHNPGIEASIDKGLEQAKQGLLRKHEDVMRDMRNRFNGN